MFKLWPGQDKDKKSKQGTGMEEDVKALISSNSQEDLERAAESLSKVLKVLGRHSFDLDNLDTEDIKDEFERWAMHVLVGAPVADDQDEEQQANSRRDWGGLQRFVMTHRQHEKKYVTESLADLRDVLVTFSRTIGQAVIEDQETDRHVVEHLGGLQAAAGNNSIEEMKKAVVSAAQDIGQLITERTQRQQARVEKLGSKLQKVQEELGQARKQMELDPLTQLYNRAALDMQLERVVGLSILAGSAASLFMIDIDHFKHINDAHGHRAGDAVLRQLADRLVSTFLRKNDFIARYGGEELTVLLQGDGLEVSQRVGERLLETIRGKPFEHEGLEIPVTVSIGLAILKPGEIVGSWVERADQALYQAKERGRDQMCVAESSCEASVGQA